MEENPPIIIWPLQVDQCSFAPKRWGLGRINREKFEGHAIQYQNSEEINSGDLAGQYSRKGTDEKPHDKQYITNGGIKEDIISLSKFDEPIRLLKHKKNTLTSCQVK